MKPVKSILMKVGLMKKWQIGIGALTLLVALALVVLLAPPASAHETREVGDYALVFGWQVEPAYVGVYNGPELTIRDLESDEPVTGAEKTLKLQVSFGNRSKQLTLRPVWNEPGHYVAQLTPTRPGDYSFTLTGVISATGALTPTVVNEVFTSADGDFSTVELASDHLFPDSNLDGVSLQRQIDALKAEIEALREEIAALQDGE